MDYHELHGSHEVGVIYGTYILRHDRARTYRRLMRLLTLAGDPTSALQEELGVSPVQCTQRLYERIRADRPPDAPSRLPTGR